MRSIAGDCHYPRRHPLAYVLKLKFEWIIHNLLNFQGIQGKLTDSCNRSSCISKLKAFIGSWISYAPHYAGLLLIQAKQTVFLRGKFGISNPRYAPCWLIAATIVIVRHRNVRRLAFAWIQGIILSRGVNPGQLLSPERPKKASCCRSFQPVLKGKCILQFSQH